MFGVLPDALAERLTARDLATYQALVEIDGPWWGAREAAYAEQLASVVAATAGGDLPPERFAIQWTVGAPTTTQQPNLIPPADGLAIFAERLGITPHEVR